MSESLAQSAHFSEASAAALIAAPAELAPLPAAPPKRRRSKKSTPAIQRSPRSVASPVKTRRNLSRALGEYVALAKRTWLWLRERRQWQVHTRRMRLCETVSLGEKRFLAIVKVDGQHFLIGAAAGSVSLLTQLAGPENFAGVLRKRQRNRRTIA